MQLQRTGHIEPEEVIGDLWLYQVGTIKPCGATVPIEFDITGSIGVRYVIPTYPNGLRPERFQLGERSVIEHDHPLTIIQESGDVLRFQRRPSKEYKGDYDH
jgi:hypothetical protein